MPDRNDSKRKIHVMQLTTGLGIGGAEIVVRDLARAVDRDRFHLSVCCRKLLGPIGRELQAEGIDIYTLPGAEPERADYFTAVKLRRVILEKRVDVVHSHTTHALADSAVCRSVTRAFKALHTFHFGNYPHKASGDLWLERVFCRVPDKLIAVGEVQREQIKAALHLSEDAIEVVRNGVTLPDRSDGDPTFRARIGAEGKVLVGTIATLIKQKGLPDLMRVARRVRDERADVHFVVVGEGDMRPELERLRSELRLEDTVTFTGWLTNAATLALPTFDVYIQPSLWEAMSISILEAMGAGKPVISTRVGEAPHLIKDGVNGLLVESRDITGMAGAVLALAGNEKRRHDIGAEAARTVTERFTVGHMARAYEQVYLELLHRSPLKVTHAAR